MPSSPFGLFRFTFISPCHIRSSKAGLRHNPPHNFAPWKDNKKIRRALFFDREYGGWELLVPDRRVVPMPEITDSLYLIPEGDLSIPAIDVDEFATEPLRLAGMG